MNVISSAFVTEPTHNHEAFLERAMGADQLIDAKLNFVMERARSEAVADSNSELGERCQILRTLEEHIQLLEKEIERNMQCLLYRLHKSPAPSRLMDNLPG